MNTVFTLAQDEVLYAVEEGIVDSVDEYWGRCLFYMNGDDMSKYSGKTAFSSGILLFKNCEKIRHLFQQIKDDIKRRPIQFGTYDQPYIVYNACINDAYDNKALHGYAHTMDMDIHSKTIIRHYAGAPGYPYRKIDMMTEFLRSKGQSPLGGASA